MIVIKQSTKFFYLIFSQFCILPCIMSSPSSLQFTKLYCQIHPCELVTNYCNDEKCLVGLCATCVCSHTDMHAQIGTVPQYQNVRDTFCILNDDLRAQVSHIEEDKCKLGALRQAIEVKKITIRKTIRQLREDALSKIKEEFDFVQKKIMAEINAEQKKRGYHSNLRFQSLEKNLARQTDTLLGYIEGLNSSCFLDWAKKLKREALTESNQIRKKIEKQIEQNETYTSNLKMNQGFITELENSVRKAFTLEFVIPKQNQDTKNCMTIFKPSNLNVNTLSRSTSAAKVSQNLIKSNSLMGLGKFVDSTSFSTFYPDGQKFLSNMSKQSFARKNQSIVSDLSQGDMEQNLARSSYISTDTMGEAFGRHSMINNVSAMTRPNYQNDRLSTLMEAKRSFGFDGQRVSTMTKQSWQTEASRIRM